MLTDTKLSTDLSAGNLVLDFSLQRPWSPGACIILLKAGDHFLGLSSLDVH